MPLPASPAFAEMLGAPAWQRAAFDAHTALVGGVVQLAWDTQGEGGTARPVADTAGAGLAFDNACRLYHGVPAEGRVERWLWGAFDPARPQAAVPLADVLTEGQPQPQVVGALETPADGFVPKTALPGTFTPRALACDDDGHLYALDSATQRVWIVDLAQRRVLREIVAGVGLGPDDFFQRIASQSYKDKLRENTEEVIARGGFGTPTMFLDGNDMYFGNDRIELIRARLAAGV